MEWLMASATGLLTSCGIYLMLRGRTFDLVLGISLLSYAVNLFIFSMGGLSVGAAPIISAGALFHADPLPPALVLTAIVIGFAMSALLLVLAVRQYLFAGSDASDAGHERRP